MLTRMSTSVLAALLTTLAAQAAAQTPPPPAGGGAAQMVRAAGMPLNDGALAPGTLTVRVVQGAFTGNLSGLDVELTIEGQAPKRAPTGADGRAQFAHVPIGARVQASATVGDERLVSEAFAMPAESGVRLLLVTSDDFVDTATAEAVPAPPAADVAPVPDSAGTDAGVTAFRAFMVAATAFLFALVGLQQWRRRA